ncbi:MAG: oligoendopeptidase F [Defluviitaleaceae bacterium]|nr:oligoendopeptidase F [Defluviitaleaceae bacterium]
MPEKIKARHEIADEFKWRTSDVFAADAAWESEYSAVGERLARLEAFRGNLGDMSKLLECLRLCDELEQRIGLLWLYALLKSSEDTANSAYAAMNSKFEGMSAKLGAAQSFIVPEILTLDEWQVRTHLEKSSDLALYRQYLENIWRQKAHVLSPEMEEVLALAHEITDAPETLFSMIDNADMKFGTVTSDEGEVELTHGRYKNLMESKNRDVRREAFTAYYRAYIAQKNTLAANLNAWVKRNIFYANMRKYDSALHGSLSSGNIPVEVYTNLIDTVRKHNGLMYRYIDIRRKFLGLDELHFYDIYTPIVKEADTKISWEDAKVTLLKALAPLGTDYVDVVRRAMTEGWIDVYENEGKASGAYCAEMHGAHPYVLMNFNDTIGDLLTLAHEVGHMIHSYYSHETQPYVYGNYTIFVAEVASTVNEALLMDYLLRTTDDKNMLAYLVNESLEGFRGTIFRQTMFAEFEMRIHEAVTGGNPLTHESLCEMYSRINRDYYGDGIIHDDEIGYEWARIPHFYMGFYVYQYATGMSAAQALARGIISGDVDKIQAYLKFLGSGCSDYSINLLREAGVDMSSPAPIEMAMAEFESLLDKMESFYEGSPA